MSTTFDVGVSCDFLESDGGPWFADLGLDALEREPGVRWEALEPADELSEKHLNSFDALMLLGPKVTEDSLRAGARAAIIARFGVGYDHIDVEACTRAQVAITITPEGVRRPVATAILAMLLGLAHRTRERDIRVRENRWADKFASPGTGVHGRVVGLLGLGQIALDFTEVARPLGMRFVAYDPFVEPSIAHAAGVELLALDDVLAASDFLCVTAPLTPSTHHLVDGRALALMKPSAFLINAARGPLVDEQALAAALGSQSIAGAALDVFEREPLPLDSPLLELDNVMLSPHNVAHTDELYRGCGHGAVRRILAVARGKVPDNVVNPAVLNDPAFCCKLSRWAAS